MIWMLLRRPRLTPKQCAWTQQQTRKKWRRTRSTSAQSIANRLPRSDLGRKFLLIAGSLRPARMGVRAIDIPAVTSFCRSVKKRRDHLRPRREKVEMHEDRREASRGEPEVLCDSGGARVGGYMIDGGGRMSRPETKRARFVENDLREQAAYPHAPAPLPSW